VVLRQGGGMVYCGVDFARRRTSNPLALALMLGAMSQPTRGNIGMSVRFFLLYFFPPK